MIDQGVREEVVRLKEKGMSIATIARQFGISRGSVYGILNGGSGNDQPRERGRHRPFITKKKEVAPERPSPRVRDRRDDVEVVSLEVERQKGLKELKNIIGSQVSPELQKKKDEVEIKKLDFEEFEANRKLAAARGEEERKAQIEEEVRIERERERRRIEAERKAIEAHTRWVGEWQEWGLSNAIPRGVSIPVDIKFRIKDAVAKALMDRSEQENDIEELVKITTQSVLQPFLDKMRAEKKIRLIESWAFPQIDTYIKAQGLEGFLNEEGKGKIREDVKNHFMKVLSGSESFIFSFQVADFLDIFLKPLKEKVRGAREEKGRERQEREKQAREKRAIEERDFWQKRREKREKERVEELVQTGMSRFNYYLLANRKELGVIDAKEQERAKRFLERELKEKIKGNEDDEEVEKLADGILDEYFFEE